MSSGRGVQVLSWNKAEMTYSASGTPTVAKQYRSHPKSRATQTVPRLDLLDDPTEPFAVDLEFQQSKREGDVKGKQRIGRVSVVNTRGDVVYDVYTAHDNEPDVKKSVPPPQFNVEWRDLSFANGAKRYWAVKEDLKKILGGRTVVLHGPRNDEIALGAEIWETFTAVDTQSYYGKNKLSVLAQQFVPEASEFSFHNPTDDAKVTMLLYLRICPFNGRVNFKDAPFTFDDDDFPAIGSTPQPKRKMPKQPVFPASRFPSSRPIGNEPWGNFEGWDSVDAREAVPSDAIARKDSPMESHEDGTWEARGTIDWDWLI